MIATTIEQSKRLLAAGIDPISCDMRWTNEVEEDKGWGFIQTIQEEEYHLELGQPFFDSPDDSSIPAWSLSKLWDILHESGQMFYEYPTTLSADQVLESLVEAVKRSVKTGRIK